MRIQTIISSLFDRVYVVSLPRSKDRRAHIKKHFLEVGLDNYDFFDAFDQNSNEVAQAYAAGEVQTYPPCFRCGKESCGREDCNNVLIAPQVAVFLTYLRLWEMIAAHPQRALIVEDDVVFHAHAPASLACLSSAISASKLTWSADLPRLLRLGWALGPDHSNNAPFRISHEVRMSNPCHSMTSAFAQALLDRHRRISTTADIYVHRDAPNEGESITILPPIASELSWSSGTVASLIHPKQVRSEYLRQQGDELAALANDQLLLNHRGHATPNSLESMLGNSPPRLMTSVERWNYEEAFSQTWAERNSAMLALFEERLGRMVSISFAEYGCGPHAHFSSIATSAGYVDSLRYDMKEWPIGNLKIDLNSLPFSVERTSVGVLSGVIEYLNDPHATLACLSTAHKYLLFSYAIAPNKDALSDAAHVSALHERCAAHGWRNHFDLRELTHLVCKLGYLEAISMHNKQIIALLRIFDRKETP